MEMNEQMQNMMTDMGLTAILEADGKTVREDNFGPIVVNAQNQRVMFGANGPLMGNDGEIMLIEVDGNPVIFLEAESSGLSLESIMALLPTIEGFLWPEMQGEPVIMKAIAGDAAAVAMVQDKLGVFGVLASSGPEGLRDNAESLTQKTVDFVGGIISSALGNIGVSDDGEAMDFPTEIDRSTGVIRILGEVGLFLQSFDTFAKKMAPNYDRPDNYMVELFLRNLDALMASVVDLMGLTSNPDALIVENG